MATFAERLTAARKAAGMTQEQLSEAVHVARNTISNWERGQRQPDLETLRLLGKVLHTDFLAGQEPISEAPADVDAASGQDPQKSAPKKRRWPIVAAVLAVIALGVVLWLALGNGKTSSYEPAARLADETGQLSIEFFQKPVQQADGMPYLAYSFDTSTEMDNGQSVFFYTFHFRETNGLLFKIKSAVVYSFTPIEVFTDAFSSERLTEYGIAAEIPAYGEWSLGGGFPSQPYRGVAIILYGEDEQGTEMEFHGFIEYPGESAAEPQP